MPSMEVSFKILRQQPNDTPYLENFTLEVEAGNTILDCLNRIKWELDGTLAFRKNCRNTICGSCGMKINGRSALACQQKRYAAQKTEELKIAESKIKLKKDKQLLE